MKKTLLALVAVAGLTAGLPQGVAMARDYYGAIAYSTSTGAHGYSYDYDSRYDAEQRALNECYQYGGGCQVAIWFRNACGALAVGPNGWGADWHANRSGAESKAIARCSQYSYGCSIVRWVCTTR